MSKNLQLLMDALRNEGMRYTKQRKIVWDEICQSKEHRDAEEIYLKINKNGRKVSRATVYRTIDVLVKNNLVGHFVETVDGKKKFKFYKKSKKALGLKGSNYSKGKKSRGKKSRKVRK